MVNLLLAGNDKVSDGLLIVILSYLAHNKEPVTVYFLTMDLTEKDPNFRPLSQAKAEFLDNLLKKENTESSFRVIDMKKAFKKHLAETVNIKNFYTPYAMLRLLADKADELPDKILYLDTDIIIAQNIEELYNTNIEDYEFAASLDMMGRFWISYDYQNSGVMLLNMKKIRETGLFHECRHYVRHILSFLPDQDALNKKVEKKYILPDKFNEQGKPKDDTVIKHFPKTIVWLPFPHTRNIKPWEVDKVHRVLKMHEFDDVLTRYQELKEQFKKL